MHMLATTSKQFLNSVESSLQLLMTLYLIIHNVLPNPLKEEIFICDLNNGCLDLGNILPITKIIFTVTLNILACIDSRKADDNTEKLCHILIVLLVQTTRLVCFLNMSSVGISFTFIPAILLNLLLNKCLVFHAFQRIDGNVEGEKDDSSEIDISTTTSLSILTSDNRIWHKGNQGRKF